MALLKHGVVPHQGEYLSGQEKGFYVWTSSKMALRHTELSTGKRSLVTLKVPQERVRFPDWCIDVEGIYDNHFLLDGLYAKHPQLIDDILKQDDFRAEMKSYLGPRYKLAFLSTELKPVYCFLIKKTI